MNKLLVFSDLHLTAPGETIIGLDPAQRFRSMLDHALAHHADAAGVVLLGDLTHRGTPAEYAALKAILDGLRLPLRPTIGNHDSRARFRAAFPQAQDQDGFAQCAFDLGLTRVVVLDTADETGAVPRHAGHLCDTRLDWFDAELRAAAGRPLLVFCHHPPFATGFDGMDAIRLMNGDALLDRLAAHDAAAHLICGHVHRTISGTARGVGFSVLKSPCHQMPMRLGDPSSGSSVDEPGGYAVVLVDAGAVVVHAVEPALDGVVINEHLSH